MSCFFFKKKKKKKNCLMSCLKFTLSDVTSFLPYNLFGLKKSMFRPGLKPRNSHDVHVKTCCQHRTSTEFLHLQTKFNFLVLEFCVFLTKIFPFPTFHFLTAAEVWSHNRHFSKLCKPGNSKD